MAAWFDVQANPERATTVGNAALVAPGMAEVEAGGELALGPTLSLLTPVRVKLGLYETLQVHLATEGLLVRPDVQRPAGLGAGFKVPLWGTVEDPVPRVAARVEVWSPFPVPEGGTARLQAEVVASGRWGGLVYAAAAGGDFTASGPGLPMGGLAFGLPEVGPVSLLAEARYRAGRAYAGLASAHFLGRQSAIDVGVGYRFDGAIVARMGITRGFALAF